ncbi:MAG: 50S ribosomal protein L7/L12 [Candidatus Eremiobacterota bacterium]
MSITKEEIIEAVKGMTVLDLVDLVKTFEEEFGVTAGAPMMMAGMMPAMGGAAPAAEAAVEKTEFDVVLEDAGKDKIKVIKAVRKVTTLGLKEAKDLVEGAPKVVKEAIPKEEAEKIKQELEAEGAKVAIK